VIDLAKFIGQYLGVANTGENPVNRGQCVGLIEVWLTANKKPHIPGNAVDLLANADLKVYKKFGNTPTNIPLVGAVVCWNATWGGGYGHTAVVVAANVNQLVVFEQNDPTGAPPVVATHNYNGVAGWLTF
jgi:surface antigen